MKKLLLILGAAGLAIVIGCAEEEKKPAVTTGSSQATQAFASADTLLASSVPATAGAASVKRQGNQILAEASDTYCAASGSPLAIGSETGSDNTDEGVTYHILTETGQEVLYNRRFWWCMMNHKSNGPDTVRGSIMKLKGFMCATDAATGAAMVFDGVPHTITISISSSCFTSRFATIAANQGLTTTSLTYTATTTPSDLYAGVHAGWNKAIKLEIPGAGVTYHVLLNIPADESQVAAMIKQVNTSGTDVYGFTMDYSGSSATIRYEGRFYGYTEASTGNYGRHIRTIATGTYTGDGGFSNISSASGVFSEIYRNSGPNTSYNFRTLKATSSGLKSDKFYGSAANYAAVDTSTATHVNNTCYSGCSITGMTVDGTAKGFLLTSASEQASSTALFPGHAPLSFSSIDLTSDVP